jgi:hypothetical protein
MLTGAVHFGNSQAYNKETLLITKKKEVLRDQRSKLATKAIESSGDE